MSKKARTVQWCEGRILQTLSKQQRNPGNITRGIRSIDEEHNFDIAYINLLTKKQICKSTDKLGMAVYKLVA